MNFDQKAFPAFHFSPPLQSFLETLAVQLDQERVHNALLLCQLAQERHRAQELEIQLHLTGQGGGRFEGESEGERELEQKKAVGLYPSEIRRMKIARYKAKLQGHLLRARQRRGCKGRSIVAQSKPRVRGRFVKTEASV